MSEEITAMPTVKLKLLIAHVIKKREELNAEMGYWNRVLTVIYGELQGRNDSIPDTHGEKNDG